MPIEEIENEDGSVTRVHHAEPTDECEPDGMAAVAAGVKAQRFPHTMDAMVWAKEFNETLAKLGHQPFDAGWLVGWFANAIMAGYDTARMRERKDSGAENPR